MDRLPSELLHKILNYVRNNIGLECLSICCRLNKKIQGPALHLLYRDVVLTRASLTAFNETSPRENFHLIKSLTLRFEPEPPVPDPSEPMEDSWFQAYEDRIKEAAQVLSTELQSLATHLESFAHLNTFSIFVHDTIHPTHGFDLIRSDTALLIKHLPTTVIDLEIDHCGLIVPYQRGATPDICAAVREVLPRLSNIRLHLRSYCLDLFRGITSLSNLETASINCTIKGTQSVSCDDLQAGSMRNTPIRYELCRSLRDLASKGAFQTSAKIALIDKQKGRSEDPWDSSVLDMFRSYNPILDEDLIMPSTDDYSIMGYWWVRTPSSEDVFGGRFEIEAVVENTVWRDTTFGGRCVIDRYKSTGTLLTDLQVMDKAAWKRDMGKKTFKICYNENRVGHRIVDCEKRALSENELPISWTIPPGWHDNAGIFVPNRNYLDEEQ